MAEILHTAFYMHFHGWKLAHFNQHFIRIRYLGFYWQKVSIGWVKGLVPNRWQAITWINDNQDTWSHCSLMAPMVSDILVNTDSSTGMTPCWCHAITSTSYLTVNQTLIYSLTPEQKGRHFVNGAMPNSHNLNQRWPRCLNPLSWCQTSWSALFEVLSWRHISARSLPQPILISCEWNPH